jgi:uncharacterized repeat protein (TIGR01451 family)
MTLDKSNAQGTHFVDTNEDGNADVGEFIQFTFALANTGGMALHNVVLTDPLLGGVVSIPDSADANGLLDAGETWTSAHNYALTAADIAAGHVENDASATALDPADNVVTATAHFDFLLP